MLSPRYYVHFLLAQQNACGLIYAGYVFHAVLILDQWEMYMYDRIRYDFLRSVLNYRILRRFIVHNTSVCVSNSC